MTETALAHARLQDLVAAFADGELPPDRETAIRQHLRSCARCRAELSVQQSLSRALAQAPIPAASARLRHRIDVIGASTPGRRPLPRNLRWAAPVAAALALVAVVGGAWLLGRRGEAARPTSEIALLRDALTAAGVQLVIHGG